MKLRYVLAAALVAIAAAGAGYAQQRVQLQITNKDWEKPFPGFKIVGNLYYVGTYDLAAYLISTNDALTAINSGAVGRFAPSSLDRFGIPVQ